MTKSSAVGKVETLSIQGHYFKCSKTHRLCIAMKLHAISLIGRNTRVLGVIWWRIHVTELLLSSLSPSFSTTCQIWESVSVSDFPHCCPAICFRLLMAPTASQRSTGNTVLKHNKELATQVAVSLIRNSKNHIVCGQWECTRVCRLAAFAVIGWFLRIYNIQPTFFQVQVGQTWRKQSVLLKSASVTALLIGDGGQSNLKTAWKLERNQRISKKKTNFTCEHLRGLGSWKGRKFEALVSRIQGWEGRQSHVGRG